MKKSSIKKRILCSLIGFSLVLIVMLSVIIAQNYYDTRASDYENNAFGYARSAADLIDGDRIEGYLETGKKDAYYQTIQNYLNSMQKETDMKYYYVFVPYENDLVYVWDAEYEEGTCELGQHEEYMSAESRRIALGAFSKDPEEVFDIEDDSVYGFIGSAYSPIYNSAGEPVALVGVDLPMPGILRSIYNSVAMMIAGIIAVTILALIVFFNLIDRNLIRPINTLTESADKMVDNLERDKAVDINLKTGDELEKLADAFVKMDTDLREYIEELSEVTAEKERIDAELNVATNIQAERLPRTFPYMPERGDFDLYATMTPAKEVGGDFYDFFMIDKDHIALVIADVSGKGVPAALFMVIAKTLIKNDAQPGVSPAEILRSVNDELCEGNDSGLFVTVWIAVVELSTGKGWSVNAGHEHPAVCRRGREYELRKYRHSPAVATIEGLKFRQNEFQMEPGGRLFVYTDGVSEATNANNELYGTERLIKALNANLDKAPSDLLPAIKKDIDRFVDGAPQFDDITMLCFEYKGN